MDIPRIGEAQKRKRKRIVYSAIGLILLAAITMGLQQLKPAPPSIEGGSVWRGKVKQGEMLITVRGPGTLLPEEIRWIPAVNSGRIEKLLVLPGTAVKSSTIILELSNPELEQAAFDAEWQVKAAEAELDNLRVT